MVSWSLGVLPDFCIDALEPPAVKRLQDIDNSGSVNIVFIAGTFLDEARDLHRGTSKVDSARIETDAHVLLAQEVVIPHSDLLVPLVRTERVRKHEVSSKV